MASLIDMRMAALRLIRIMVSRKDRVFSVATHGHMLVHGQVC